MMQALFQHNVDLKSYNTFGLDAKAKVFAEVNSLEQLKQVLLETDQDKLLFLGGGSNVLFCNDYDGLVIHNAIKGIQVLSESDDSVLLKIYSGELWHDLVMHCVEKGWGGIENMSLIPGTVGAAPMQNIGAYGVELEQVFESLEALNLKSLELQTFKHDQCQFGYRESVFKRHLKGQYFIFSVTLRLSKMPVIHADYGDIVSVLEAQNIPIHSASIKDISNAVIKIRQSKLPDPAVLGNSGSFFKNPTVSEAQFNELKLKYPDIKGFVNEHGVKIPAAWLIEKAGWKGKQIGQTGSHAMQALVIVNYGGASGDEIWQHAQNVIESIVNLFNIQLEAEVNIIRS